MKATGVLHDMTLRFSPLIRHSRCLQRVNPGPDQRFVAALSFFVLARSYFPSSSSSCATCSSSYSSSASRSCCYSSLCCCSCRRRDADAVMLLIESLCFQELRHISNLANKLAICSQHTHGLQNLYKNLSKREAGE